MVPLWELTLPQHVRHARPLPTLTCARLICRLFCSVMVTLLSATSSMSIPGPLSFPRFGTRCPNASKASHTLASGPLSSSSGTGMSRYMSESQCLQIVLLLPTMSTEVHHHYHPPVQLIDIPDVLVNLVSPCMLHTSLCHH